MRIAIATAKGKCGLSAALSALTEQDFWRYVAAFIDTDVGHPRHLTGMIVAVAWLMDASEAPMIRLHYSTLRRARSAAALGPAPFFRVEGSQLFQGPENRVVARYRDSHWEIDGFFVSSYEFTEPTCVHFEKLDGARCEIVGPFQRLHFPNGSCVADGRRLAYLSEEKQCWMAVGKSIGCRSMVIVPA